MKVLLASASVDLAYGGPAVSVAALAAGLARAGVETGLWCPDGSAARLASAGPGVRLLGGTLDEATGAFGRPDLIHDSGLWWRHNHRIARHAAAHRLPRVVSTRGMLEPWARAHRRWRKEVAWRLYQARDLRSAGALHVTSPPEGENLAALMPGAPVACIGNGLELPAEADMAFAGGQRQGAARQALFLGRLHPVKGLPLLLGAWHRAAPPGWSLVLAGPDENGHRHLLEQEIARLGLGDRVAFAGPVSGADKTRLLAQSQLFVLPSHSESFGMAAGEALAHGLPVVTTTNVPWPQLVDRQCGWRVAGTVAALAGALAEATGCPPEKLAEMGRRGRHLVAGEFGWDSITRQFIDLYASVIANKVIVP